MHNCTIGAPLHTDRGPVEPKDGNDGVPLLFGRRVRPHEGVAIVGARHNLVGDWVPVHAADNQVVLRQKA